MLLRLMLLLFSLPACAAAINDAMVFPDSAGINNNVPDEKVWQEQLELNLPAAPQRANLVAIEFDRMGAHRYFVDAGSLSVGKDAVVRYTLVAQAGGGARTVSYEGMHCTNGQVKLYAFGREDGSWSHNTRAEWRNVPIRQLQSYQRELFQRYFCHPDIALDAANLKRLLKNGGLR